MADQASPDQACYLRQPFEDTDQRDQDKDYDHGDDEEWA